MEGDRIPRGTRGIYIYIYGTGGNNVAINYTTRRMSIPDSRDFL